jgi:hypothetical protein
MRLVNNKNRVSPQARQYFSMVDRFKEVVETLNQNRSTVIEEPLTRLLIHLLNKYNPKKMSDELSAELVNVKDYLYVVNNRMIRDIMDFIGQFGNSKRSKVKQVNEFLIGIADWSEDKEENTRTADKYYDACLYKSTQFDQNAVQNLSRVYPSMLTTDTGFNTEVPKSWELSENHRNDIMRYLESYYRELEQFKQNPVLTHLIEAVIVKVTDLMMFIENIPVYTQITKDMGADREGEEEGGRDMRTFHLLFDKETIYMLFSYCFYSIFHEYIMLSKDPELVREHRQVIQKERRERAQSRDDDADQLHAQEQQEFDDDEGLDEVQITMGSQLDLKQQVCTMLLVFLDIEMKN